MKILTQLLVFILSVVLVGFMAVALLSYTTSRNIVTSEVFDKFTNSREKHQQLCNGYFEASSKIAQGLAQAVKVDDTLTEEKIHELLKANLAWNPQIYGMTVFLEPKPEEKGKKLFAPYYYRQGQFLKYVPAEPRFQYEEQGWYKEPKASSEAVWTEPYYDSGAGAIMTTYSVPIYRGTQFIGLATVDINLDFLSDKMNDIQVGRTGYAVLVSEKGTFLTHPLPDEYVLKQKIQDVAESSGNPDFIELASLMLKGRSGSFSLMDVFSQKKSWVTFGKIPATGYSLALFIPENELMQNVHRLSRNLFWICTISVLLIIISIVLVSWRITSPIKSLSQTAREIAAGDLNKEILTLPASREVRELTHDLQTMVQTIKQTLADIEDEKEKFETVFTNMSDAIVATDVQWNVINCNKAAAQMLDVSLGINFMKHVADRFQCNFELQELLDYQKREKHFEIVRPESNQVKEMIFVAVMNTIVDVDGCITSYVLTIRDVTHLRHEEMNKNTLLSLISHKIMTPITVLLGTASLFQDKVLGELSAEQMQHINKMVAQAGKVQNLVDRLITYVSLTEKTSKDHCEEIDIKQFCEDFKRSAKFATGSRSFHLNMDVQTRTGKVKFNPEHLVWILKELIENAIKFNPSGDIMIDVQVKEDAPRFVMKVRDNGIGIPAIYHEQIFDKFFQVDKDFTGNKEGIGLGLSLLKTIVDQYGGKVAVVSHEGEGATFILEFLV